MRHWPPGEGEMVERIRSYDWAATSLGPLSEWSERLRSAVELCVSSAFASWVCWGRDLVQIYNDAAISTVATKHPHALGSPAHESWSDVWDVSGPLIEHVLRTGQAVRGDDAMFRRMQGDGPKERYFTFCYSPLRNEEGKIAGIFIVSLDTTSRVESDRSQHEMITRLRQSEAERRQGEERLRLALDAAKMGIWIWEIAEHKYLWNEQLYRILGYEPGSVDPGHESWARRVHPDDLPQLEQRIPEILKKGQDLHAEHRVLGCNDEVRWVESWGRFTPDEEGRPIRYFGVMADITERKNIEQSLRDSEERLRLALDAAEMGIWEWDVKAGTYRWNDQTFRLLGYEPQSFVRVHPDDLPRLSAELQRMMEHPREAVGEYRAFGQNDELRWLEARGRFDLDKNGSPQRYYGVLMDITARKRAEERDRILTAEVNHRAKNLLAVVQAVALQTARSDTSEDFAHHFNSRLAGLAASQDLLVQSHWRGVDAADLVRSQLSHFEGLIGQRILLNGPPAQLKASAAQTLGMIIHELATNASKHGALSSPTGTIEVSWGIEDQNAQRRFTMQWVEGHGPTVKEPVRRGFGHSIIVDMAEYSLEGRVTLAYPPTGLVWQLSAPVSEVLTIDV